MRGLDYYSHTVFEFVTNELGAQGTLCGGGRYDGLFEILGGKPTPAVGWGMGLERVLELISLQAGQHEVPAPDVYAIVPDLAALPIAMQTIQILRLAGVKVQMHASGSDGIGSMKSQFKKADASAASFALVFGAEELKGNCVTVKALRDGEGRQLRQSLGQISEWAPTLQLRS